MLPVRQLHTHALGKDGHAPPASDASTQGGVTVVAYPGRSAMQLGVYPLQQWPRLSAAESFSGG